MGKAENTASQRINAPTLKQPRSKQGYAAKRHPTKQPKPMGETSGSQIPHRKYGQNRTSEPDPKLS